MTQGTNTYLVGSGHKRLLIDAGEGNVPEYTQNLAKVLDTEKCSLKDLVITHWHHDHVGGVKDVLKVGCQDDVTVHKFPRLEDDIIPGVQVSELVDKQ